MSNNSWINKLQLEVVEPEDGVCIIVIQWDDEDPELAEWTSWGEQGQRDFIINSLYNALECFIDDDH
jgi:hypothetical protein